MGFEFWVFGALKFGLWVWGFGVPRLGFWVVGFGWFWRFGILGFEFDGFWFRVRGLGLPFQKCVQVVQIGSQSRIWVVSSNAAPILYPLKRNTHMAPLTFGCIMPGDVNMQASSVGGVLS